MNIAEFVNFLNGIAWGPWMLILLVGTGVYLSTKVGFIQFTRFGYAMKHTLGKLFQKQTAGGGEGHIAVLRGFHGSFGSGFGCDFGGRLGGSGGGFRGSCGGLSGGSSACGHQSDAEQEQGHDHFLHSCRSPLI